MERSLILNDESSENLKDENTDSNTFAGNNNNNNNNDDDDGIDGNLDNGDSRMVTNGNAAPSSDHTKSDSVTSNSAFFMTHSNEGPESIHNSKSESVLSEMVESTKEQLIKQSEDQISTQSEIIDATGITSTQSPPVGPPSKFLGFFRNKLVQRSVSLNHGSERPSRFNTEKVSGGENCKKMSSKSHVVNETDLCNSSSNIGHSAVTFNTQQTVTNCDTSEKEKNDEEDGENNSEKGKKEKSNDIIDNGQNKTPNRSEKPKLQFGKSTFLSFPKKVDKRQSLPNLRDYPMIVISSSEGDSHEIARSRNSSFNDLKDSHSESTIIKNEAKDSNALPNIISSKELIEAPKKKESPQELARRCYERDGLTDVEICKLIRKDNPESKLLADLYFKHYDFHAMDILDALRLFMLHFLMGGETGEKFAIIESFSKRYMECNEGKFKSLDACSLFVSLLVLLNTDLHIFEGRKKMTQAEFIKNSAGQNDGEDFPVAMLKDCYRSISSKKIDMCQSIIDLEEDNIKTGECGAGTSSRSLYSSIRSSSSNEYQPMTRSAQFSTISHSTSFLRSDKPSSAIVRRRTFSEDMSYLSLNLSKKELENLPVLKEATIKRRIIESNGQPINARTKICQVRITGPYIIFTRSHRGIALRRSKNNVSTISLCHAFCELELTLPNTFRVTFFDYTIFLITVEENLQDWVESINTIASACSAQAMPLPVSSQKNAFKRPILPSAVRLLSVKEQLYIHQAKVIYFQNVLEKHLTLQSSTDGNVLAMDDLKLAFIQKELKRYNTYVHCLKDGDPIFVGSLVKSIQCFSQED